MDRGQEIEMEMERDRDRERDEDRDEDDGGKSVKSRATEESLVSKESILGGKINAVANGNPQRLIGEQMMVLVGSL